MPNFIVGSVQPIASTLTLSHTRVEKDQLRTKQNPCPLVANWTIDKISRLCARHHYRISFTGPTLREQKRKAQRIQNHVRITYFFSNQPLSKIRLNMFTKRKATFPLRQQAREEREEVKSSKQQTYSTLNTLAPFLLPAFLRLLPFSKAVASCSVLPRLSGFLTL